MDEKQDKLVPQRKELQILAKPSLTPSESALTRELDITAANSKTELNPELSEELFRLYAEHPPEVIEWVFREHRKESDFFPGIARINSLLKRYQGEKLKQKKALLAEIEREEDATKEKVPLAEIWSMFKKMISRPKPKLTRDLNLSAERKEQEKKRLEIWLKARQDRLS